MHVMFQMHQMSLDFDPGDTDEDSLQQHNAADGELHISAGVSNAIQ